MQSRLALVPALALVALIAPVADAATKPAPAAATTNDNTASSITKCGWSIKAQ